MKERFKYKYTYIHRYVSVSVLTGLARNYGDKDNINNRRSL